MSATDRANAADHTVDVGAPGAAGIVRAIYSTGEIAYHPGTSAVNGDGTRITFASIPANSTLRAAVKAPGYRYAVQALGAGTSHAITLSRDAHVPAGGNVGDPLSVEGALYGRILIRVAGDRRAEPSGSLRAVDAALGDPAALAVLVNYDQDVQRGAKAMPDIDLPAEARTPASLAVYGNMIYVVDTSVNRVLRRDPDGSVISRTITAARHVFEMDGVIYVGPGTASEAKYEAYTPDLGRLEGLDITIGVAPAGIKGITASGGMIYVVEQAQVASPSVMVRDYTGAAVRTMPLFGTRNDYGDIAVFNGLIYVLEDRNDRFIVMGMDGTRRQSDEISLDTAPAGCAAIGDKVVVGNVVSHALEIRYFTESRPVMDGAPYLFGDGALQVDDDYIGFIPVPGSARRAPRRLGIPVHDRANAVYNPPVRAEGRVVFDHDCPDAPPATDSPTPDDIAAAVLTRLQADGRYQKLDYLIPDILNLTLARIRSIDTIAADARLARRILAGRYEIGRDTFVITDDDGEVARFTRRGATTDADWSGGRA